MAIKLENKENVVAPDAQFPRAAIKDDILGDRTGTPFNTSLYGDIHQFVAKMLAEWENLGFDAPNGFQDDAINGFQTYDAFLSNARIANEDLFAIVVQSMLGEQQVVDPAIPMSLFGLTTDSPATAIEPGFIFYESKLFVCSGIALPVGDTTIVNIIGENLMEIVDGASGTGEFDFSAVVPAQKTVPRLAIITGAQLIPLSTSLPLIELDLVPVIKLDNFSSWDSPQARHIPKKSGFYEYSIALTMKVVAVIDENIVIFIRKNGVVQFSIYQANYTGNDVIIQIAGDYIQEMDADANDYTDFIMSIGTNPAIDIQSGKITTKYLPHG